MIGVGACVAAAVWCVYATGYTMLHSRGVVTSGTTDSREVAKLERWVEQLRDENARARALLNERTNAFQQATLEFEERHNTLKTVLDAIQSGESLETAALRGDGSSILVRTSIDEAEARQSRVSPVDYTTAEASSLNDQIEILRADQMQFLAEAETLAVRRTEEMRGVLRLTGVGVGRIQAGGELGGPMMEISALGVDATSTPDEIAFAERVVELAARLEEARYYGDMVDGLPLGDPIGINYRLTSPFGIRTDPFNRRPGWHNGLDLAAGWNAPITASGPGTVIYAGYKSGYGRVVDVDHGFGFVSRYAHLNAISVEKGDEVAMGDKLGLMGSSGRSTGPHLHYEVLFHGKGYDPVGFMKAGKHVHES